jgi:hypothetical protein
MNKRKGRPPLPKELVRPFEGIRIDPELKKAARALAKKRGIPYSNLYEQFIKEGLERAQAT